ncbi:UDP-N-acetylglucosamine--N-acetylmuramyl-(pentapeptide) pyrophosphoryl-undecaprenol N-acetylglucosamine transferase [Luteitalea sp. TBR-22]|uniref:undecaprenyldiphospho-muramoylpentapeptide beta-N-acetylglucosaminyltransferase n=1 Tax=Luteitalea sp. TBR-22 TaxID=2802971 RepID=UPI001AF81F9C|nr:undecaprenyldiphospho-muramoylpentapeptide beta-N-acetylglucosaminyltransferase [Luteitalea sp. TBR-22]BCS35657.1 UDP-N-acetylglucosamine--N-acetylmuramyl-(pentapeptide) pyrophosphoryl-undecaprenol N-acetylglucosamine transferase [Luteitalea sp. TBR-22]
MPEAPQMQTPGTRPRHVVIAGGGTGGHLYPGIAVAHALRRRDPRTVVTFVGTARGIEARIVPQEGFDLDVIRSAGLKGKSAGAVARGVGVLPLSALDAWQVISRRRPDLVIGVGGYSSGPVVALAAARGIPTLLLEQNATPGLTNRWLARLVDAAGVTYESSLRFFHGHGFVSGNPVREAFLAIGPRPATAVERRVLVFGGSQGANAINQAMVAAAAHVRELAEQGCSIVHQTGERDLEAVKAGYAAAGLTADVRPFISDMPQQMAAADVVVCRAGATTLAELTAAGRVGILIPFPQATDDHQRANARTLEAAGAAVMLDEVGLTGERLAQEIRGLLLDDERRQAMATRARGLARPDAADVIAAKAESLMQEGR